MIKKEELRIGNIVLYKPYGNKDGEMKTIQGMLGMLVYFDRHSNESGMFHNLQPIPLTTEILEKCGFDWQERVNEDRDDIEWLCIPKMDYVTYKDGKFYIGYGFGTLDHIKFLHQLQNLFFALTGEELEIKLPL